MKKNILKAIIDFFRASKTEYWHRDRSIEVVAMEKGLDLKLLEKEVRNSLVNDGRVEAVSQLSHRFHIPLSAAWRFVDKLDSD